MNLFNSTGRNARLLGTALLMVTFLAGALAGAAGERVLRADAAPEQPRAREMRGGPGPRRLLQDEKFLAELGLTEQQKTQIKRIMDTRDLHAKHVWNQLEPRLKAVGDSTRTEIQKVLTPEQVKKLEAEIEKRHAAWKERHKCHADSTKSSATHRSM